METIENQWKNNIERKRDAGIKENHTGYQEWSSNSFFVDVEPRSNEAPDLMKYVRHGDKKREYEGQLKWSEKRRGYFGSNHVRSLGQEHSKRFRYIYVDFVRKIKQW